jgi:RNA:NAD 2'-phosphotransferase (TPT1/KptA family)
MGRAMTNSEVAKLCPQDNGQRTQVSHMRILARSHQLVWCGNAAEIRDEARNSQVLHRGTIDEMVEKAKELGLLRGGKLMKRLTLRRNS